MFIHDSLDTGAFSISSALYPELMCPRILSDPLPSVSDWDYKELIHLPNRSGSFVLFLASRALFLSREIAEMFAMFFHSGSFALQHT